MRTGDAVPMMILAVHVIGDIEEPATEAVKPQRLRRSGR